MAKSLIEFLLRLIVGGVFIYAGAVKAWDTQQFALDVQNYQLTSWTMSIVAALYLPWLELFAGPCVVFRRFYLGGLAALSGMTVVFLGAIGSAWVRGLDISCGCFGKEEVHTSYPVLIGRDLLLLAVLIGLVILEVQRVRAGLRQRNPGALISAGPVKE